MRNRLDPGSFAGLAAVAIPFLLALVGVAVLTTCMVHARDDGQWGDVPPNVRTWFKDVHSPHGVPCCDIADGHRTDFDIRGDGYWIPDPAKPGEWMAVPPEAVVYNAGNPVGEAVVWYVLQGPDAVYIRCFVPGGGV